MAGMLWLVPSFIIGPSDGQRTWGTTVTQEVTEVRSEPAWVEGTEGRQNLPGSGSLGFKQAQLCFVGIAVYLQALGSARSIPVFPSLASPQENPKAQKAA